MFRSFFAASLLAALLSAARPAAAFDIQPTASVIELPHNRSGITLVVRNPRKVDLAITTEMVERLVQEDGSERQEPADDLFLVFPPQAVIPAGGTQTLRVQWLGAAPGESRSFHLFASEVPVQLESAAPSQLQTILRMGASVHVAAAGTEAKPVITASSAQADGVRLTVANEGQRFLYVDSLTLDFGGKRIGGMELAEAAGRTLVPPGGRRTFTVKGVSGTPVLAAP